MNVTDDGTGQVTIIIRRPCRRWRYSPVRIAVVCLVFQDKIWVAGGMSSGLTNEVWSLDVPAEWFEKK